MTSFREWSAAIPGAVFVLGYTFTSAAKSVWEGHLLVSLSPAYVAFHCFMLAQVIYLIAHPSLPKLWAKVRTHWRHVVAGNVTTMLSWLAALYALSAIEPAVVSSLVVGTIPLITLFLAPWLRPSVPILHQEIIAAIGAFVCIIGLIWMTMQGLSGLGDLPWSVVLVGVIGALLTALGVSTNTYVTKALTEREFSSIDIMTIRFTLLNVAAFFLMIGGDGWTPYSWDVAGTIVALTVMGVFIGVYLLQIGIGRTEPMTVSLLFTTNLIFTYLLQLLDPRLATSPVSLAFVCVLSAFTIYGTVSAERSRRRQRLAEAPTGSD